jgi:hypothetical protein
MRRAMIMWAVVFALLIGAFVATIAALNSGLYSAPGFVREYLEALERKDSADALALPGVDNGQTGDRHLLTDAAIGELSALALVSDREQSGGAHLVTFSYRLADGIHHSSFTVESTGPRMLFFSSWKFVASPLSTLAVAVSNADEFSANRATASTRSLAGSPREFLVFSPGTYKLDHRSTYLSANETRVTVTSAGAAENALLEVLPNQRFDAAASSAVNSLLDLCVTQKVLMPTGCPFGERLNNRIVGAPQWSMVDYPKVALEPGTRPGSWLARSKEGEAHILVKQKSIFDGRVSIIDNGVPFFGTFVIAIRPDDTLDVQTVFD